MSNHMHNTNNIANSSTTEKNKNESIKINTEYQKIVPSLTAKEYDSLKYSIRENSGNVVPIIVNQHGIILDGHHRIRAAAELGMKVEVRVVSNPTTPRMPILRVPIRR